MKKNIILFMLLFLLQQVAYSQDAPPDTSYRPADPQREQRIPLRERLFFGGDLGLQFGDITYINIAPTIGYRLTEKFAFGVGPSYSYFEDKRFTGYEFSSNSYGGRLFGQYMVFENVMAYGEYEVVNSLVFDDEAYYNLGLTEYKRVNIPALLVGGGYVQQVGGNSSFNLMVLFDVIEDRYSFYQNPIIRAGFNVGF